MPRADKVERVESLRQNLLHHKSALLVDYRTLTVAEMTHLRQRVGGTGGMLRVVKNTLFRRALEGTGTEALDAYITGPTAVAFAGPDVLETVRALVEYARTNPKLQVRGGFVEGRAYPGETVERLARLPGRAELLGQLVGSLHSPIASLVHALGGLIARIVWTLEEIEKQKAA